MNLINLENNYISDVLQMRKKRKEKEEERIEIYVLMSLIDLFMIMTQYISHEDFVP